MYESNLQSDQNQFWLNAGLMILIAGLFVAGLYYYQQQQLSNLQTEINQLKDQLATLNDASVIETPQESSNSAQEIAQEEIIEAGPRDLPRIALTFDADMTTGMQQKEDQWYDPEVIEILKEEQIPATFFLTGLWAETYPDTAKQLADNNLFEIESHGYQTKAFSKPCHGLNALQDKQKKKESITKAQQSIKEATGQTPTYFRFPGGCYQEQDLSLVNELGLKAVQWDVVSGDAFAESSSYIVNTTVSKTRNGSVVVLHLGGPNAPHTAQALKEIIPQLKEKGFRFATLHSLLNPPSVSE